MPSRPNRPVYFRETDAKRIAQQTREREREYRGHGLGYRATAPRILAAGAADAIGITAESIPARSGTTLGHGTVTLRHLNSDWTTTALEDLECGNATGGAIPTGKWCGIRYIEGVPVIVWADC